MSVPIVAKNIIASLILQISTIVSGFVIPKIILRSFGSEVYGLTASITQFLGFIALLEGGLSGVVMASLYKPLREKDFVKVSGIVNATDRFFKQIGFVYSFYVLIVIVVYPFFVDTVFSLSYIRLLIGVLAINLFVQYFFSLTFQVLLRADRKVWVVSTIQVISVLLNILLVVICVQLSNSIIVVKLIGSVVFLVQPVLYFRYARKNYSLDKKVSPDEKSLNQRWDGFGQNVAYFVHTNTDIIVLTLFATLSDVAVYSVYFMIANALKTLVMAVSSAITPSIGNVIAEDDLEASNRAFSFYEFGMWFITTVLFSCGIVLIVPFVSVYTSGITDADYIQPVFGVLILMAEMIYCVRDPYVSVAYAAGCFKQTAIFAYIEAALNVAISVLLVERFGLIGVSIGTIVSMLFRTICHVLFLGKNILFRSVRFFCKNITCFSVSAILICVCTASFFEIEVSNYLQWFLNAIVVLVTCLLCTCISSFVFYRREIKLLFERMKGKRI